MGAGRCSLCSVVSLVISLRSSPFDNYCFRLSVDSPRVSSMTILVGVSHLDLFSFFSSSLFSPFACLSSSSKCLGSGCWGSSFWTMCSFKDICFQAWLITWKYRFLSLRCFSSCIWSYFVSCHLTLVMLLRAPTSLCTQCLVWGIFCNIFLFLLCFGMNTFTPLYWRLVCGRRLANQQRLKLFLPMSPQCRGRVRRAHL